MSEEGEKPTGTAQSRKARLSVPSGGGDYSTQLQPLTSPSSSSYNNSNTLHSTMTLTQYIARLTDVSQMDLTAALNQMKSLLSFTPSQIQKVYKLAYYRKQTKDHWARDDPAFVAIQIVLLALSSFGYAIAFRSDALGSQTISLAFQSILINYGLVGILVATAGRALSNQHLSTTGSSSHIPQRVEWMYAFDIHCNAFFPLYVILYVVQFVLLPILLGTSFVGLMLSNTLYGVAFSWYFYVTHLGYRALPFLSNTEVFLFPIAGVVFIFVLNILGYPFGFGWNASRIMAHLYFEMD